MKEVFDLAEAGSKAEVPRSRAEWARTMAVEIQKQGIARINETSPDENFLYDTMADPNLATVEAALERNRLLLEHGTNVAAMALDASATINAGNSIERMLTHQLAVAHKNAMQQISRAHSAYDVATEMKRYTLAAQFMKVFQQGMLTLKKIRQGGQQKMTVQYVNVSHGSQAVVGNVERKET